MIHQLFIYEATGTDPWYNLATEKYLMESLSPGQCTLYLWQNQNTVVIGRNQNAWAECRVSLLEQEGGRLARRLSGGGAVFHDTGNLNFTFLLNDEDYDLPRQLSVIQRACALLGIDAQPSGRNDLLAGGAKFSGNAFYHSQGKAYHHGTLLIKADMDKLSRYLSPSKAKLEAKGVRSVRSRVINLSELAPSLTVETMKAAMNTAFAQVYGLSPAPMVLDDTALARIEEDARKNADWQWLFGSKLPFSFQCEARFSWGCFQLQLETDAGCIRTAKVYTDAMDWQLPESVEAALTGCRFGTEAMCLALSAAPGLTPEVRADLIALIREQEL